ncbi:MAG: CDGSH iron-sulfur domain-containing protein [Gemmatimonadetes bacterium]|nr:CDGSH iron-sulfur domain-containing protein [Gemmatimonadota bacterium]NNK63779.1 hypothetical protein [Gemmatimonadota bacterium]
MAPKVRSYESDAIVVDYDLKRCIHAAECVHGLPSVFDPDKRPWIEPGGAAADELARVIERCPTGALQYRRKDGGPAEAPPAGNTVRISPDGPVYVSGRVRLTLPSGETIEETRMALCRCGQSRNKPFCDNAHAEAGFSDGGVVIDNQLRDAEDDDAGVLEITLARNGPLLMRGPVEIQSADGSACSGARGALCRCGHSANKPFCDGSHARQGFEAE